MKYGVIAGNSSINRKIYDCFEFISEDDADRLARKFRSLPPTDDQDERMHTFRELILGAYIGSLGYSVVHERVVAGKTPDWCIVDREGGILAILEIVNFNAGRSGNVDRLYAATQGKFATYKQLAEDLAIPYLVGVHGDFFADVEPEEMEDVLYHPNHGLFQAYPAVSGVLFFVVSVSSYPVTYYPNPSAVRSFDIPSGVF
jgi:hypothetical protein